MAFNAKGFKTISHIGTPDTAGAAGTNRSLHCYVTNDDAAAVETSGYFNSLVKRLIIGDQIMVSLDIDGTPAGRIYVVSSNNGTAVGITNFNANDIA